MKRFFAFLLALLMLLSLVTMSSCAATDDPKDPKEQGDPEEPGDDEPEEEVKILPELPEVNYNNEDFTFYQYIVEQWIVWNDLVADDLSGEPISDAVYSRNNYVEEKYGVHFVLKTDEYQTYEANVKKSVQTGDHDFDVMISMGHDIPRMYGADVFYNLHSVPYLDFDKPWWDQNCIESFTLAEYMPFTVSDMTVLDKGVASACYFNKKLVNEFDLGNLYDDVYNYDWTIDRMIELGEAVSMDADGNDVWDDEDVYGLVCNDDPVYMLFHGAGGRYITKDEDGYPELSFDWDDNFEIIQYYLEELMYDETLTRNNMFKDNSKDIKDMFCDNQGLFMMNTLSTVVTLRKMESDYGILPIPMYDSEQKEYYSSVSVFGTNLISVPIHTERLEMTGVLLEALAAESKYTVIPAFYDTVLKDRSARDKESVDMLDIIINNMVFDVGDYYNLADFPDYFLRITGSAQALGRQGRTSNIASFWEEKRNGVEASLEKLIDIIDGWNELEY